MKFRSGIHTLITLSFLIFTSQILSQTMDIRTFRNDLVPLFDSLIPPPEICEIAYKHTEADSLDKGREISGRLKIQYDLIQNIFTEYTLESEKAEKYKFGIPGDPNNIEIPRGGPGQDGIGPPSGNFGNRPNVSGEVINDFSDANLSMDRIIVNTKKYKEELGNSIKELNRKLKTTVQNDQKGRVNITNEFLTKQLTEYKKYSSIFRFNLLKLEDIIIKYGYGENIKYPPLKSDILSLQKAMISNILFLISITKEFSLTGAKFYAEFINSDN